ncbi:MAG: cadherin repeat domain-containing protein, partial [Planctomycetota bacterium]
SDADATTNTITYSLDDDAGGLFAIDGGSGVVTVSGALDYETATSHDVTVRATSADGSFSTKSFTIAVTDVNDSPPIIPSGQTLSVSEDAISGTIVGRVVGTDADTVGGLQDWKIMAGNVDGIFKIDGETGEISVADPALLDYETTASYVLLLTVSDGENTSDAERVTLEITDVDELPDAPLPASSERSVQGAEEPASKSTDPADDDQEEQTSITELLQVSQTPVNLVIPNREAGGSSDSGEKDSVLSDHDSSSNDAGASYTDRGFERMFVFDAAAGPVRNLSEQRERAEAQGNNQQDEAVESSGKTHGSDVYWEEPALDTRFLWDEIDSEKTVAGDNQQTEALAVGTATVMVTALSAGYCLWILRSGWLLGGMLSSVPAWRLIDPLPILDDFQLQAGAADENDEDEESLESLLAGSR